MDKIKAKTLSLCILYKYIVSFYLKISISFKSIIFLKILLKLQEKLLFSVFCNLFVRKVYNLFNLKFKKALVLAIQGSF